VYTLKVYSVWFDTTVCGNHDHTYSRGIHKPLKVYSVWFDTTVCGNHDHTYSRGIHKPLKVYSVWYDTTVCGNHDHTYSRGNVSTTLFLRTVGLVVKMSHHNSLLEILRNPCYRHTRDEILFT
jgi:transcription elongation factor Elf1